MSQKSKLAKPAPPNASTPLSPSKNAPPPRPRRLNVYHMRRQNDLSQCISRDFPRDLNLKTAQAKYAEGPDKKKKKKLSDLTCYKPLCARVLGVFIYFFFLVQYTAWEFSFDHPLIILWHSGHLVPTACVIILIHLLYLRTIWTRMSIILNYYFAPLYVYVFFLFRRYILISRKKEIKREHYKITMRYLMFRWTYARFLIYEIKLVREIRFLTTLLQYLCLSRPNKQNR